MTSKKRISFIIVDVLCILLMILPYVGCIVLKVLTTPKSEGINLSGAQIYYTIDLPLQPFYITEATVVSAAVVLSILGVVLYFTHGLKKNPDLKRQFALEYVLEICEKFVVDNMGERFADFAPLVAAIMTISAFSSLTSLLGLYPPTSDMNIVVGWAILSFILITHYKLKGGILPYLKDFTEPIPVFTPFNIIGEISTPISMAFRHYGNVLSGVAVSTLIAAALGGLSSYLTASLPGFFANMPIFRVGIPAVLSLYFDIFSGCMQAFIFAILTMLYVSNGFPEERYNERMKKKAEKRKLKEIKN